MSTDAIIAGTNKVGGSLGMGRVKIARGNYDFAVQGGAQGDIVLAGDTLPLGAMITDALVHVETVPTGATATIAIKVQVAADINAADAISGAPWSTTGVKRLDFVSTSAPIKTTAARVINATVGTADLTAGKFQVLIFYVELG